MGLDLRQAVQPSCSAIVLLHHRRLFDPNDPGTTPLPIFLVSWVDRWTFICDVPSLSIGYPFRRLLNTWAS
jgi:hypothetical protein